MRTWIASTKALFFFVTLLSAALLVPGIVRGGTAVAPVEKTGQTTCWDADGNQISCAGTGQDGELQTGVAWPNPRFTDNGNGTVKDNLTGLIWLKNANPCGLKSWADALAYCNSLASGTAGLTDVSKAGDWRLPNVKELQSLIDFNSFNPAIAADNPFTDVQSEYYWSNTQYVTTGKTYLAHRLTMHDGMMLHGNYITDTYYVWPVRDEEKCSVSVDSTFLTLKAGLLPKVRRIVITGDGSNWDRSTAVSIEDIPIVIPMRVQPAKIIALIVIPSTLTGFTQGEKAVGVATGTEFCSGTVEIH